MPTDPPPDLDPAEADLIRVKARILARQGLIPRADVPDVEQALALALVAARAGFDPARGSAATYAATVVRNAVAKLLRRRFAARRNPDRVAPLAAEPTDPAGDPTDRAALAVDVGAAVAALPPGLRAAAEALKIGPVAEAARLLGVSRATMYARVREIRRRFERAGLAVYG